MELIVAEDEVQAKKRKVAGLPVKDVTPAVVVIEDEDVNKQQKALQKALELDKEAGSDGNSDGDDPKGNVKCVTCLRPFSDLQLML